MTTPRNLFDFNRARIGDISEDADFLRVIYEFNKRPYRKNKIEIEAEHSFNIGGGKEKWMYKFENEKTFILEIKLPEGNLNYLYEVTLSLAYILGSNFEIQYPSSPFTFIPVTRSFNIHSHCPNSIHLFNEFLDSPVETTRKIIHLFSEENGVFHYAYPTIAQINAFNFADMRFVVEYGLLEGLSKSQNVPTTVFSKNSAEYKELKKFTQGIQDEIKNSYPNLNVKSITGKLTPGKLNEKGTAKEKILSFLRNHDSQQIKEFCGYVPRWANLRNKLIVHGISTEGAKEIKENRHLIDELHHLHLELLDYEFRHTTYNEVESNANIPKK